MTRHANRQLAAEYGNEIARQYRLGYGAALDGPFASGEQGDVWRLETDRGRWAVKALSENLTNADVDEAVRFQQAAIDAGIGSPGVRLTLDGRVITSIDDKTVRVYDWVDLREPDRNLEAVAVGTTLAKLHRVPFEGALPLDPWNSEPVGIRRWDFLVGRLVSANAPFADEARALRDDFVALERLIEEPTSLRTCHRDLFAENLRLTAAGDICVLDWDDCGLGDTSHELAVILFEYSAGIPERAHAIYRAYRDGGPGSIDRAGQFTMAIAQLGHILERAFARWLDPNATEDDRSRAAAAVDEFTASPMTGVMITDLVEAIR